MSVCVSKKLKADHKDGQVIRNIRGNKHENIFAIGKRVRMLCYKLFMCVF